MRSAHDVAQVRAAEAAVMATLPPGTLMERAATGLAATVADVMGGTYGLRVVALVGSGDNGGDALWAAALLARRGARVDAVLLTAGPHAQEEMFRAAGGRVQHATDDQGVQQVLDSTWWQRADVVLDGIVGIGGRAGLMGTAATIVQALNDSAAPVVVAVDLPSGVDPDTGAVGEVAVAADVTVCLGTYKPALLVDPAAACAGRIELVDIGVERALSEPSVAALQVVDVLQALPRIARDSDKYQRGVVGVVAGSAQYPGAAHLCALGALRMGAGYVRLLADGAVVDAVRSDVPEVVAQPLPPDAGAEALSQSIKDLGRVAAWAVGPGLGIDDRARALIATILAGDEPVVLDADAITVVAQDDDVAAVLRERAQRAMTVMTPHAGELARLMGWARDDIEAAPLVAVRHAAQQWGCTVLLKGPTTVVAGQQTPVFANPTGTPWLGTAGTGDVLTGAISALMAAGGSWEQGTDGRWAAAVGAFVHGVAGQMLSEAGTAPLRARELADMLPHAVSMLRESDEVQVPEKMTP